MRYWAYLIAKLAVAAGIVFGFGLLADRLFPAPHSYDDGGPFLSFQAVSYALARMALTLFAIGLLWLIIWDQRYRCRVCLRRLRMPIETGSWSSILQFGRPRIEYICPYGHGTLKEDELQISGRANPEWTPNSDDIWEELSASASSKDSSDRS